MAEFVKLQAPDGATSVTWMQKEYQVVKGFVRIEAEAVKELISHGFSIFTGKKSAEEKLPPDDSDPDGKNPDGTDKVPE